MAEYTVILDDKIATYFEQSLEITPEEWLAKQAINQADIKIENEYRKNQGKKTRDDKIAEIKKED